MMVDFSKAFDTINHVILAQKPDLYQVQQQPSLKVKSKSTMLQFQVR